MNANECEPCNGYFMQACTIQKDLMNMYDYDAYRNRCTGQCMYIALQHIVT